jgi:L-ribulose-5-phosphate 4-epimerase
MTEPLEGVIKFSAQHTDVALDPRLARSAADLDAWRSLFVQLELIGQDPKRYQGLGFGNLSARITTERGETQFLISGSQTGAKPELELADFSLVSSWTVEQNSLVSTGQTPPSSESLTHGAFYDADPAIRFVFHAHSPEIWHGADQLGLSCTAPDVAYGTPEMAQEVARICRQADHRRNASVIAMMGHPDGVFASGETADQAALELIKALARARALLRDQRSRGCL